VTATRSCYVGQAILPAAAFQAALSALAVRGMQAIALCGRQSWLQAAFQGTGQQTTHAVRTYSSGFVFAGIPQRSLRNSSRIGNGGLKGRLQARLPAARMAKVQAAAFQAVLKPEHISRRREGVFLGFVSFRDRTAKPEKFVRRRGSRLKAGCSQDWLPHKGPTMSLDPAGKSARATICL
jgi:hypothetical protein